MFSVCCQPSSLQFPLFLAMFHFSHLHSPIPPPYTLNTLPLHLLVLSIPIHSTSEPCRNGVPRTLAILRGKCSSSGEGRLRVYQCIPGSLLWWGHVHWKATYIVVKSTLPSFPWKKAQINPFSQYRSAWILHAVTLQIIYFLCMLICAKSSVHIALSPVMCCLMLRKLIYLGTML